MDGMDGIMNELDLQGAFPAAEMPDDEPEPAAGAEPGPDTIEFWQKKDQEQQTRLRDAQAKVSDQGQQLAATNEILQNMLRLQQEQMQSREGNGRQAVPTSPGWSMTDHLNNIASGASQAAATSAALTPEQAAKIGREEAEKVLTEAHQRTLQQQQIAHDVYNKFINEEPELYSYRELAAQLFWAAPGDINQKYQQAVGRIKNMIATGNLPPPPKQNGRSAARGGASGGQQMPGSWASPSKSDKAPVIATMATMKDELHEWVQQRKEIQDARKEIRPVRKVGKIDFLAGG